MSDHDKHTYDNIDRSKVEAILRALTADGARISGNNPWSVDTGHHGVMLQGLWDETSMVLSITVTNAAWYVPRASVWENIDSLMRKVEDEQGS